MSKTMKLDDIAKIERGRFSPRPRNDPRYYGGDIPFVQTGDVSRSGTYILEYSQTLNEEGLAVSKLFPKDTILMTIAANIGDVSILNFDSAGPDSLVAFTPKEGVSNKWLFHVLSTMKNKFDSLSTQNAQKNLSLEKIKPVKVQVPSYEAQVDMASTFDAWDLAIEKTEELIDAKERQFGWLQKSVLDDVFKSYNCHLSDYAGIMKHQKIEDVGKLKPLTVKLHCKGIEPNERDMQITLSKKGRPYFQRVTGEFLIGRQNFHNGGFGIVPERLDGFIASNAITTLEIDKAKLDPRYLFYFFSRKDYYLRIGHIMDGTGQRELSDKQIMKLPVSIPNLEKQKEVVALLDTAQQEINLLKKLADQYRTQKRGLMQKLPSGEWHIKNKEAAA